jgi:hypothetical protein
MLDKIRRYLRSLLISAALCVSPLHATHALAAEAAPGLRAFVNASCVVADEPFMLPEGVSGEQVPRSLALLGIIVGKLTEALLNHTLQATSGQIAKKAARKDTHYTSARDMNLFRAELQPEPRLQLNGELGCITIVTGRFQPDGSDCTAAYVPRTVDPATLQSAPGDWRSNRSDDSLENPLRRANICLEGAPSAVYEARFEFSADGTAWRLSDAGYRVNALLTARPGEERNVFYTIEITQPGATEQRESISLAWLNIGRVRAGESVPQGKRESTPWLRVPALSTEARRAYENQTRVHQQVAGEIDATRRAVTRNQRLIAGLDERIAVAASPAVAKGLGQQKLQSEVQVQTLEAEIQARTAEYDDLPKGPLEFMPVHIEVGVTESRSEKEALMALSKVVDLASPLLASYGTSMATSMITRSIDAPAAPPASAPQDKLDLARGRYLDRLADYKASVGAEESAKASVQLALARDEYNAARRALGLEAVK